MADAFRVEIVSADGSPRLARVLEIDDAVELVRDHHDLHAPSLRATFEELDTADPAFEIALPAARGGGSIHVSRATAAALTG